VKIAGNEEADVRGRFRGILTAIFFLAISVPFAEAAWENDERTEIALTASDFQKLDTFEGHVLGKADGIFSKKDYRGALAEYNVFMEQYPKSTAMAYVLLRRGRCFHLDNKRFEAIKAYNEVLDYFPNAISYASSALFYIGLCHFQNGDSVAAVKSWTEMVQDEDYRKSTLAAVALCRLGDLFMRQNKADDAAKYYTQAAIDFRRANPDVALFTMEKVVGYLIRRMDEPKLADFYQKVFTFNHSPGKPSPADYWASVKNVVIRYGGFAANEKVKQLDYYRYWTTALNGKLAQDDATQLDWANLMFSVEADKAKWTERMDRQFAAHQKPGDYTRVIRWIRLFADQKNKVQEYYGKLTFSQMNNAQIEAMMTTAYDSLGDGNLARNTYEKIQQDKWTDGDRSRVAGYLMTRDVVLMERVIAGMKDKNAGLAWMMRYYYNAKNADKAIALAKDLIRIPAYNKEACMVKAEMLVLQRKYQEAIAAYQEWDNPPSTLYAIASCYRSLGKIDQAVGQLREIEAFFKDQAPEAAMRIAYIYRDQKDTVQYIANLRGIMKKYPASGHSNVAHEELERLGYKIGGALDAK
jgi:tetratricopeptide (TPR) repeat protein